MFFNFSVTDGAYKELGNTIVNTDQNIYALSTNGTKQLITAFRSSALNITTIPVGIWNVLVYGRISAATQNVRYTCEIYTFDSVESASPIATSNQSEDINSLLSNNPSVYTMNITLATAVSCQLTTRLVAKLYVQNFGSSSVDVQTFFQNTYYSFIQTSLNEGTTLLTSNNNWTGNNSFNGIEINNTNISVPWKVCFGRITTTAAVSGGATNANNNQGFGATFGGTPQVFLSIAKNGTTYTGSISSWTIQLNAIPSTTGFFWSLTNNSSAAVANSYQVNWFAIGPY